MRIHSAPLQVRSLPALISGRIESTAASAGILAPSGKNAKAGSARLFALQEKWTAMATAPCWVNPSSTVDRAGKSASPMRAARMVSA